MPTVPLSPAAAAVAIVSFISFPPVSFLKDRDQLESRETHPSRGGLYEAHGSVRHMGWAVGCSNRCGPSSGQRHLLHQLPRRLASDSLH